MLDLCHWKPLAGWVVRGRSGGTYEKKVELLCSRDTFKADFNILKRLTKRL